MSARLNTRLSQLKSEKRAGFVPFIMAGDPSVDFTKALLPKLASHGADLIELGMPFSDPMADGPTIQAAGLRSLKAGFRTEHLWQIIRDFRSHDIHTPLIVMGYSNPVHHFGIDAFMQKLVDAGGDGIILVDVPVEEQTPYLKAAKAHHLDMIQLIAPTSLDTRLPMILENASGFAYYIAVKGITGTSSAAANDIAAALDSIRQYTGLPIATGFGIRSAEDVRTIAEHSDLVVVGSAIVQALHEFTSTQSDNDSDAAVQHICDLCRELSKGVKRR